MDRVEFHRLAERELNEVAQYYDREEPGLGSSFLQEVDRCLRSIEAHPEAGERGEGIILLPNALLWWSGKDSRRKPQFSQDAVSRPRGVPVAPEYPVSSPASR